jgi:site-specific DNA-methyltransferase (adenine-specific)
MQPPAPYFDEDGFTLLAGDSLELLPGLEEASAAMIFADPPYNLSNGGFTCQNGRRVPVHKGSWDVSRGLDADFSFHLAWIGECRRLLQDGGTIWISGTYHSIYACGFALQQLDFHILNDIAWYKPNGPPNLSGRYFTASHETLIWARKGEDGRHRFNYLEMKEREWPEDPLKIPGRQMRSVWSIPSPGPGEKRLGRHPTQKPCALLARVILASTAEGDLVIDPFSGSATTGLAAWRLGRRFIGVESEREYLDLSVARFRAMRAGDHPSG